MAKAIQGNLVGKDIEKKCKRAEDIDMWLSSRTLVNINLSLKYNTEEEGEGREENNLNPN